MNREDAEWLKSLEAWATNFNDFYNTLSPESAIWFWIAVGVGIVATITFIVLLFIATIKSLNNILQSNDGWRPIRFSNCMWAGTALSAIALAYHTKTENQPGWSVILALGTLILIGFLWFMIKKLRIVKATGACLVNFSLGAVVAPIVIQLSLLLILMALALIAFYIWSLFQPRTVYVINR